jgi:hypothetical protein
MRAIISRALVAAMAMMLTACDLDKVIAAFGVRTQVSAGVPGCYALYAGTREVDSSFYNATHLVRLDSTVSWSFEREGRRIGFRALRRLDATGHELDNEDTRGARLFSWWADSVTDTLRLSFVNGFSGAVLALAKVPGTDTLRGRIEEHWDFGPPFVTNQQPAHAIKIPCK